MQRVALARLTSPAGLMVWTTTRVLLNEPGPLAPIWLQSSQAGPSGGSLRQHFYDMIPCKKAGEAMGIIAFPLIPLEADCTN
jgi:hypothetical protein